MEWIRIAAANHLHLTRDVALGDVLLSVVGRSCVTIENYRGILVYSDSLVKLQARTGILTVTGKRLQIEYYTHEELKITGQIKALEFSDG